MLHLDSTYNSGRVQFRVIDVKEVKMPVGYDLKIANIDLHIGACDKLLVFCVIPEVEFIDFLKALGRITRWSLHSFCERADVSSAELNGWVKGEHVPVESKVREYMILFKIIFEEEKNALKIQ